MSSLLFCCLKMPENSAVSAILKENKEDIP